MVVVKVEVNVSTYVCVWGRSNWRIYNEDLFINQHRVEHIIRRVADKKKQSQNRQLHLARYTLDVRLF